MPAYRILVVEDHESYRRFVCSTLGEQSELELVGEAADGLSAVEAAAELHPTSS